MIWANQWLHMDMNTQMHALVVKKKNDEQHAPTCFICLSTHEEYNHFEARSVKKMKLKITYVIYVMLFMIINQRLCLECSVQPLTCMLASKHS